MSKFLDTIKERAKTDKKTIVLPESMDRRTFEAAETIRDGVKIQKATDFTSDAKNVIDSLDHAGGITKSSAAAGRKILFPLVPVTLKPDTPF